MLLSQGTPLALPSDPRGDLVRGNNTGTPINAAPQTATAFPALVLSARQDSIDNVGKAVGPSVFSELGGFLKEVS